MSSTAEDQDESLSSASSSVSVLDTMNKKFVIVGGGNYIGFHIAKELNTRGVFVLLVDSVEPNPEWGTCDMPFRKTNIFDRKELRRAFERAHCVIHTATFELSGKLQNGLNPAEMALVTLTKIVIDACAAEEVEALVFTSTTDVVYDGQKIENGRENLPYAPIYSPNANFSRTESIISEQLVLTADGKRSLRTCSLRLPPVYGLTTALNLKDVQKTIKMLKHSYENRGDLKIQFVSIENVVSAHIQASFALLTAPKEIGGQTYFITDGPPVNPYELFRPLRDQLYSKPSLSRRILKGFSSKPPSNHFVPCLPLVTPVSQIMQVQNTHYFSTTKAEESFGYEAYDQNDISGIIEYYEDMLNLEEEQKGHKAGKVKI